MTKELYEKCRNPLKQAFCALDAETQVALRSANEAGLLLESVYYGEPMPV